MPLISSVISWLMKKRMHQIDLFIKYPYEVQSELFRRLITSAKNTEWGKKYGYESIKTIEHYKLRVPINEYEDLKPYIDRVRQGEQQVLWSSDIKWFAKSSGTTSDKSKFIPVSPEALEECHYKGGKDMLSLYCSNNPETGVFDGKAIGLVGSHNYPSKDARSYHGDVSAILMENLPFWVQLIRTPDRTIALMNEWESKIEQMAKITMEENVTNISGVPSWTLLLLKRILELTGKDTISEIWPNFEVFIHGGVNFSPYRNQFSRIVPEGTKYLQTYNASEGFFGIQDRNDADDMLLMLDYGIYYEFLPLDQLDEESPKTLSLDEVETGKNYAVIISTNAGLWRYKIGDTVRFTSLNPFRIQVSGRTRHFINAFGEELIIDNAEQAIAIASQKADAVINEYTAAPVYFDDDSNAAHEWLIEFEHPPKNGEYFIEVLDNALKSINSDYEAKRYHSMILDQPIVRQMPKGSFYLWLKEKGKLGGQNKVPRLSNNRKYIEEILEIAGPDETY